ncbi:MAG: 2-oxoglutarate/2-oxoacid ferredoxin oxidoreductase subunit alpha [Eubacteriales bacterium]|nr:2-oxoglutarate/2-oxoacid ferredoxin oxidoreductase subunit alpha [Eubacteriales bacterium]
MEKVLMKGNEAIGEAAVQAGCRFFFGYPITPQTELPEYMARRLPEVGGCFLQAESEIGAINMVYGAASCGERVMTSSSGPGISLKQEGISYLAGAELPCVIVNIMRGGPGLGNIGAAQADYLQAVKGGGHGDYRLLVLAPASVQELYDLTITAFDLADTYRNPVMILGDGILGQMMEPVVFRPAAEIKKPAGEKEWAVTGRKGGRPARLISSLHIVPENLEKHVNKLMEKYRRIEEKEKRWEEYHTADAEVLLVAYGTSARIAKGAVDRLRREGLAVGLFRPITLWPFPAAELAAVAENCRQVLVVEMSAGQMVEDVRLALGGKLPVHFYGRTGGMLPDLNYLVQLVRELIKGGGGGE